ncbi:MAG: hypothetical protein AB9917_10015 [Negativicutes bacterium]
MNIIDMQQISEGATKMSMNLHLNECQPIRGAVRLEVRKSGRLLNVEEDHNVVVLAGRAMLAGLLGGRDAGKYITHVGVGTSDGAATEADTNLTGKVLVAIGSASYDGAKVRFNFIIGSGQANGVTIRELGLFFSDGTMFSRRVRRSAIGKEDDIEITGYWDIYL